LKNKPYKLGISLALISSEYALQNPNIL